MNLRATISGGLLLVLGGCVNQGPVAEDALKNYRRALVARDSSAIWELSDKHLQAQQDKAQFQRFLKKNPRLFEEAQTSLPELSIASLKHYAELTFEDGRKLRLVKETEGWKVAEGGIFSPRFHTPEATLRTFFFAATGHLGLLRKVIPEEYVQKYQSDSQLGRHLYSLKARIALAEQELGAIVEGQAEVEEDSAWLRYGDGKMVTFVRQQGRWRVIDLE